MAEQTPYRFKLPGYPAVQLMINRSGQFYGKGSFQKDGIDYKGWEHRFPREMTGLEDLLASGLAEFTRTDKPTSKPVTGIERKPVREPTPAKPPVQAEPPAPKPQEQEPVNDERKPSKFSFKL